jgi:ribosomal protein S18 acetylase RimI-like enzyme
MEFVKITYPHTKNLQDFIDTAGKSLKSFRYFTSRPMDAIRFHLCTFLILEKDQPVAYGHLDQESGITWLGIAVSEGNEGKGYGRAMMEKLIETGKAEGVKKIKLSVDNDNETAIALYLKNGFALKEKKEKFSFYELEL